MFNKDKMRGMNDFLEESTIREKMKRRRLCKNEIVENEDRLSDLPDGILLYILSFLNTKHAVRTCVLSTRWKHLWKRIPTLILHSSRFSTVKQFALFVSKILTLRDSSTALHALDLDRHGDIEPQLLKKILNYVSSHNTHLRELGISVRGDSSLIMSCVSSCKLKSLEIELIPLDYGDLFLLMENAMSKKAAAKSRKEAAKLRKAFKTGLEPPAIPDGIVDFLRQNSPSAEVNILTDYSKCFNLKQIEESIKGAKITKYRSQVASPASSSATSDSDAESASAAAEKDDN